MITHAMEDYLKAIYRLEREHGAAATSRLAEALDVSPASATSMVKGLSEKNLAEHTPYKGVTLTPAGRKAALEIIRHHRLLELYLMEALGYSWDEVHDEAERLEHAVSRDLAERISQALGHPVADPHGDPIPGPGGELPPLDHLPLSQLDAGEAARVGRVADQDPEKLRYLGGLGLYPGANVEVLEKPPAHAGYLRVQVEGREVVLGRDLADAVHVTRREPAAGAGREPEGGARA